MSFNVSIICEDHTLDQYVVVPVIKAMLASVGKAAANIRVVTDPRMHGIGEVESKFEALARRYSAVSHLVLFALDRDAEDGRPGKGNRTGQFEAKVAALPEAARRKTRVILAVEEVEVWALWGSRSVIAANWAEVRSERDPKERFFHPLQEKADFLLPGAGRKRLVAQSLVSGWQSISQGCPELKELELSIADLL